METVNNGYKLGIFHVQDAPEKVQKVLHLIYDMFTQGAKEIELIEIDRTKNALQYRDIETVLVLGGDGTMLHALHYFIDSPKRLFGINCGSVGFLLNELNLDKLFHSVIHDTNSVIIHPLEMKVEDIHGKRHTVLAINEIALLRAHAHTAHVQITVNEVQRLSLLVGDGVLLSTPAGSTAYNCAVGGPIVPLESGVLLLTPISPFRPRRWRGAVIDNTSRVQFKNLDPQTRPMSATADFLEVRNVVNVDIIERKDINLILLFDSKNCLHERITKEQFSY
jgi:NAD+ kinase